MGIEQDLLSLHWLIDGHPTYHILPLSYNLYPELLDTFPFLSPITNPASLTDSSPMRRASQTGIKVVHLWHWYNPILALGTRAHLQAHAKTRHPLMWQWYSK